MTYQNTILEKPVIIITVYDRYNHLKECLESIESSEGSEKYHVIVGSDAAAIKEHDKKINTVREYLLNKQKNNKFKKLTVLYHENNIGADENIERCHLFAKSSGHKCFVFMEDDVIVGNHFLDFVADGLEEFEDDKTVIAINSYLEDSLNISHSTPFLYNRFNAYGFASWYKKWDQIEEQRNSVNYSAWALSSFSMFKKYAKYDDNAKSYPFLAEKYYKALDIEVGLMMEREGLWVLRPPISLVANRGMDGSGLRSGVNVSLQSMEPCHDKIAAPKPMVIKYFKLEDIKDSIAIKQKSPNWFSFVVYRYIPFGFKILKQLRTIKRSL